MRRVLRRFLPYRRPEFGERCVSTRTWCGTWAGREPRSASVFRGAVRRFSRRVPMESLGFLSWNGDYKQSIASDGRIAGHSRDGLDLVIFSDRFPQILESAGVVVIRSGGWGAKYW